MGWQNLVGDVLDRYVLDESVRRLALAEIKTGRRRSSEIPSPRRLSFQAVSEGAPGAKLRALYERGRDAYTRWYLRDGEPARPSLSEARSALERHMPELAPTWSSLVRAVGADELGARMLTLYDPPALVAGCSQAVLRDVALVRNYDYDPNLFDAVVLQTRFRDTRVLGMTDQLWGLLDGVSDRGLAASFTFGGLRCHGPGFAIPLVIRYILETCGTVEEAVGVLERVPVQNAYNVTVVDSRARHATVWVAPGEPARVTAAPATTNHQGVVEWREHARWTNTVERLEHLQGLLEHDPDDAIAGMLSPPLHNTRYDAGFGTLYTAVYRPGSGTVEYRWPRAKWRQSIEAFREEPFEVALDTE